MRTRDAFDRTTARLLAQRVKKKFTNPEEDIASVRVMANGVAATGGQVYNADVAGHRPGTVVKAVNVGSKAKAHYVAQYGNSDGNGLLGENDVKRMIAAALEGFSQNEIKQVTSTIPTDGGGTPSTPPPTLNDIIRDSAGPVTGTGSVLSITLPLSIEDGDGLVVFMKYDNTPSRVKTTTVPGDWYDSGHESGSIDTTVNPFTGMNIQCYTKIGLAADAGTTVSFDLETHTFGVGYGPYSGEWTAICYVLVGASTYTDFYAGESGLESLDVFDDGSPEDYYTEFTGISTTAAYTALFFVATGFSDGTFTPTQLPTQLAATSDMYLGARIYPTATTIAAGGMQFNSTSNYFVGTVWRFDFV